jgi:5'-3' exonuclease
MLALEGLVSAVFSKDSDNLVYGTPILIQDFTDRKMIRESEDHGRQQVDAVTCILSEPLLQKLDLNRQEFIDLCIFCGCDYNVNIRGYGPMKTYALMKKYRTLDNLPATLDKTVLQVDTCRSLFAPVDHRTLITGLIGREIDWTTAPKETYLNLDRTSLATCRPILADLNIDHLILPFTSLFLHLVDPEDQKDLDLTEQKPVVIKEKPVPKSKKVFKIPDPTGVNPKRSTRKKIDDLKS